MKKRITLVIFALLALALYGAIPTEVEDETCVTCDQLPFPIGNRIQSTSFTGEAYLNSLIRPDTVFNFPATNVVTFSPGSHSSWHRHGGMVVLVVGGVGLYQEEGKPAQVLRQGDVLQIPAGARHWHGATKDNWFSQMVIYNADWQSDTSQTREDTTVSDEYYNALQTEEYAHTDKQDNLMFAVFGTPFTLPTFNGPIRMSNILSGENVAGCSGLHYVVFEPSVINAWHTHAGGQVLIATDGIGYHQIEGQPVEVLYPGDVAKCPPGVRHWHGAAPNSRFAHLAANTNPDHSGVEWFDMISEEEYENITHVSSVKVGDASSPKMIYSLNGIRQNLIQKGINIINDKKIIK